MPLAASEKPGGMILIPNSVERKMTVSITACVPPASVAVTDTSVSPRCGLNVGDAVVVPDNKALLRLTRQAYVYGVVVPAVELNDTPRVIVDPRATVTMAGEPLAGVLFTSMEPTNCEAARRVNVSSSTAHTPKLGTRAMAVTLIRESADIAPAKLSVAVPVNPV